MRLRKVTFQELVSLVGPTDGAPGSLLTERALKWDVVVIDSGESTLHSTYFGKSVRKHVNAVEKKSKYVQMISSLFNAVREDDFYGYINESGRVVCKEAHTFRLHNHTERLLELKHGAQDRIYVYKVNRAQLGPGRAVLLLMAFHKKQQRTPTEVSDQCENQIKTLLSTLK